MKHLKLYEDIFDDWDDNFDEEEFEPNTLIDDIKKMNTSVSFNINHKRTPFIILINNENWEKMKKELYFVPMENFDKQIEKYKEIYVFIRRGQKNREKFYATYINTNYENGEYLKNNYYTEYFDYQTKQYVKV